MLSVRNRIVLRNPRHSQSGMVIVVALFIVALVAAMAYLMIARFDRDTRRTTLIVRHVEAENIAQGSIAWAMDVLSRDWKRQQPKQLIDKMPTKSPIRHEGPYEVSSTIYDMQGRYNINNVTTPEAMADFVRLILAVQPKLPKKNAENIAAALKAWISPGSQSDADAKYYLSQPIPYRAKHALMFNASELRMVKGVTAEIYMALQPYIVALPAATLLNVQTASAAAMVTLSPTMTLEVGKIVEDQRRQKPFVTKEDFANLEIIKNHKIAAEKITVVSDYFMVETQVTIEKQRTLIYTLIMRKAKEKKVDLSVIWQSKGTW